MKIKGLSSIADPDRFRVGADLTDAFRNITLSVEGGPGTAVVAADAFSALLDRDFASTGTRVFGTNAADGIPQDWSEQAGLLRIDFALGTDFFTIDLGNDTGQSLSATASAYDSAGNLIAHWQGTTGTTFTNLFDGPNFSFDTARIAYVTVGGSDGNPVWLDNLRFGVIGSNEDDLMVGTRAADHYNGLDGDDHINGRGGDDTLIGGAGDDTIHGGPGGFIVIDGGTGNDTLTYAKSSLPVAIQYKTIDPGPDSFTVGLAYLGGTPVSAVAVNRFDGIETIVGSKYADALDSLRAYGGNGNDWVLARFGFGEKGNDTLISGGPNSELTGGRGDDTFYYRSVFDLQDSIVHDFGRGNDLLLIELFDQAGGSLTNEGDSWTLHLDSPEIGLDEVSFQLVGVTSLSTGDYQFV